ncbi:hypothetical protein GCM10011521_20140 [Arenimonas soli]|uniref:Phosphatidic acid phosphatase type 2/haloperoxidase domain-containing protein n=2 Tax=Arenimonas soli TaxID=2269504 RepID=A0ABQ1HLX0_9GAMM|nr:hypothetical protein GCM10011521_20140 [Arenimonas soli]
MLQFLSAPILIAPGAALFLVVHAIRRGYGRGGQVERAYAVIAATLLVALAVKDMLKRAFGRTWPRNVVDPGPEAISSGCSPSSLGYINDGLHGFHAFAGVTKPYQAFPSGSTVVLLATVLPLMALYPRLRLPLAIFSLVSFCAYVLTNTHFIGDVVAGAYVGAVAGMIATATIRSGRP